MSLPFVKYSGCSNDFVLIDNRQQTLTLSPERVRALCDRRNGIGADGILLVENSQSSTCKMRIYNADGSEAEMCGNGIRCVADFMRRQGHPPRGCTIESMHRQHAISWQQELYTIEMGAPKEIRHGRDLTIGGRTYSLSTLDTGVPHAVIFCATEEEFEQFDLEAIAPLIRHHPLFAPRGTNVNIATIRQGKLFVRTYERGVEAETPACGTGATAAALAMAQYGLATPITVHLRSGEQLTINFTEKEGAFDSVTMTGICKRVFEGILFSCKEQQI